MMKKILTLTLCIAALLLTACGPATGDSTTAERYKAEALSKIQTTLNSSTNYNTKTAAIYDYTVISSSQTRASYYMKPYENQGNIARYSAINSSESKSSYEIDDEMKDAGISISGDTAYYLEFRIAYTVKSADANAANRFKTSELNEMYSRSTVKVDKDFDYNLLTLDYITDLDTINSVEIKKNGQVFTLYLNGNAVKTLSLTKDIEKAYLIGYKYYIARINEIVN